MRVLIIVDLQNDFCPGGALAVKGGDKIVPIVNELQKKFDSVIATQDYHPRGHISFASTHNKKAGEIIRIDGIEQVLWPDHCVAGTKGVELAGGLNKEKINKIFQKGTDKFIDSYSGFFDNDHKKSTGLEDYLREKKIKDIYIAGLATDYCVKYTALDAAKLGFNAHVIIDACRGVELKKGDTERAIYEMKKNRVNLF